MLEFHRETGCFYIVAMSCESLSDRVCRTRLRVCAVKEEWMSLRGRKALVPSAVGSVMDRLEIVLLSVRFVITCN